jgi:hypothetical protein
MTTNRLIKLAALRLLAIAISVIPPAVATLLYFPAWSATGGELMMSGGTALLLVIAAMPLYNVVKAKLRSPAIWSIWLAAFTAFLFLSRIANEMTVICFVGFVSNLIGSIIFRLAGRIGVRDDE